VRSASASQCRAYDVHDGEFDIAYCRFARGPPNRRTGGWRSVDTDHDALDVDVSFFGGRHRPDRLACATGRLVAGEKVVRALGHHELRVKAQHAGPVVSVAVGWPGLSIAQFQPLEWKCRAVSRP
jgi:hypothetical protein